MAEVIRFVLGNLISMKSHSQVLICQSRDSIKTEFVLSNLPLHCACKVLALLAAGDRSCCQICCRAINPGVPTKAGITLIGDPRSRERGESDQQIVGMEGASKHCILSDSLHSRHLTTCRLQAQHRFCTLHCFRDVNHISTFALYTISHELEKSLSLEKKSQVMCAL